MPKRSNDFQKLITFIYECIKPDGGTVTESGMVFDREANTEREIDILIENKIAGHQIKIAIECRDRSRKESIEWVDCIIGKVKSLDLNKVVAVSSEGFSEAAKQKAAANGIDTLTLKEAEETDWSSYFIKPGIAVITGEKFELKSVLYLSDSEYRNIAELGIESNVQVNQETLGTIKSCFEELFLKHLVPVLQQYIDEKRFDLFKTYEDLNKALYIVKDIELPGLKVTIEDKIVDISNIKMVIHGTRLVGDVNQEHAVFNEKMLSLGDYEDSDGSKLNFKLLQDPDTKKLHVNWSREKKNA